MQRCDGSSQYGSAGLPVHRATQVPAFVSGSTSQHIAPMSHESIPLTPLPSTTHGSPTSAGSGSMAVQRVAFQELLPSFAHGMHFMPAAQFCAHRSHSCPPPRSGCPRKRLGNPVVSSSPPVDSSAGATGLPVVVVPSSLDPPTHSGSCSPQASPSRTSATQRCARGDGGSLTRSSYNYKNKQTISHFPTITTPNLPWVVGAKGRPTRPSTSAATHDTSHRSPSAISWRCSYRVHPSRCRLRRQRHGPQA